MTERSTGIWICAILFAVGGILCILGGLIIFVIGDVIIDTIPDLGYVDTTYVDPAILRAIVKTFGIISIILGVACLAVAYGIWSMKVWAKIVGIILAIIGAILGFPIGTVIAIIILYFLLIDKNTKDLFK